MAILLFAAAGALWTVGTRSVDRAERPTERGVQAELVTQAKLSAASLRLWVTDRRAQLAGARSDLGPWTGATPQVVGARAVLDRVAADGPGFDGGLVIFDRQARVTATSSSVAGLASQVRDLAAVRSALNGTDALSDLVDDRLLRVVHLAVVTPLRNGAGATTGALAGFTRVPGGSLARTLAELEAASALPVALVTTGGTVLDGHPVPDVIRTVADDLRGAVLAAPRGPGFLEYEGEAGAATAASYAPVMDGWNVVMARPAEPLQAVRRRATNAAAVALGSTLALAVLVIGLLAIRLRRQSTAVEAAKQSFLAITGHELRTPLTVMKGFTSMLARRWDDVPDSTRRDLVETIGQQTRNLELLVERLLLGAQLEAGMRPSISHEAVPVRTALDAAVAHHQAIAPLHRFTLEADEGLVAWADSTALQHVLTNLVENAVKYSPDGGEIRLSATRRRSRVEIVVEDEGIGLPADLDAIFEKFVQREAVDTRTHDEGGVGLGLFIVRTLVDEMGGSVRAERRQPTGARLLVTLRQPPRHRQ